MLEGPSSTSRCPLTHFSIPEALSFSHHDTLTVEHGVDKFSYRRARDIGLNFILLALMGLGNETAQSASNGSPVSLFNLL